MDDGAALRSFVEVPFVIERPAGPSPTADLAVRALAEAGLAFGPGSEKVIEGLSAMLAQTMPKGAAVLDRGTGQVSSVWEETTTVVAGPAVSASDHVSGLLGVEPGKSLSDIGFRAFETWRMAAHAEFGADAVAPTAFAALSYVKNRLDPRGLATIARCIEAEEWTGHEASDTGVASDAAWTVHANRGKLAASGELASATPNRILVTAGVMSMRSVADGEEAKARSKVRSLLASVAVRAEGAKRGGAAEWLRAHASSDPAAARACSILLPSDPAQAAGRWRAEPEVTGSILRRTALKGDVPTRLAALGGFDLPLPGEVPPFDDGTIKVRPYGTAFHGEFDLPSDLFNAASLRAAKGVHGDLLRVVALAKEISDVDFEVVPGNGGLRSMAAQNKLKRAGNSWAKTPRHVLGLAVDLVPVGRGGEASFKDDGDFERIRDAMMNASVQLNVPIDWGGDWKRKVDKPHFELARETYPAPGHQGREMVASR